MKATRTNEILFWNSRARNYPLPFTRATAAKTRRMLRLLERLGVSFSGRALIDIGCGTGVYALPLAGTAKRVLGVDSSAAMLKVFRAERLRRGIKNAACLLSEWNKLPVSRVAGRFDIALASMTAAVKTRADVLKMEAAARERCVYIGWAGVRRNALLEKVYAAHGLAYSAPEGAQRTLAVLQGLRRKPRTLYLTDSWVKEESVEETLREIAVSMKVNGARFREDATRALLSRFTRAGRVRQLTRARKCVITWEPPPATR